MVVVAEHRLRRVRLGDLHGDRLRPRSRPSSSRARRCRRTCRSPCRRRAPIADCAATPPYVERHRRDERAVLVQAEHDGVLAPPQVHLHVVGAVLQAGVPAVVVRQDAARRRRAARRRAADEPADRERASACARAVDARLCVGQSAPSTTCASLDRRDEDRDGPGVYADRSSASAAATSASSAEVSTSAAPPRVSRNASSVPHAPALSASDADDREHPSAPTVTGRGRGGAEGLPARELERSARPSVAGRRAPRGCATSVAAASPPCVVADSVYVAGGQARRALRHRERVRRSEPEATARAPSAASAVAPIAAPSPVTVHIDTSASSNPALRTQLRR